MSRVESPERRYTPEFGAYPRPILNRIGAELLPTGAPISAPTSYVFPVSLQVGASARSSISSPKLTGPSLIRGVHLSKTGTAKGVLGFGLGKSTISVTEDSVATTTPLPFTSLFNGLPAVGAGAASPNQTDVILDVQTSNLIDDDSIGIIVLDRDWFLVVYAASSAASGDTVNGHVTVLDGINPAALANFL